MCQVFKEQTECLDIPEQTVPGVLQVWTAVTGREASLETPVMVSDLPESLDLGE